jgi:hypothetical protein
VAWPVDNRQVPPHLASTRFDRHYRLPNATRWFFRSFAGACAVIVVLGLLDNQGGTFGTVGVVVAATVLVLIVVWAERAFPRYGLYESLEGIRVVNSFGSRRVPWDQIERFEQSEKWPRGRVLIVRKDGEVVPVVGTAQGARIAWSGGETRDIVGVLNERLRAWQAQHGAI